MLERNPRVRTADERLSWAGTLGVGSRVCAWKAFVAICLALASCAAVAGGLGFPKPGEVAQKTLRADFEAPPPGYGEVPFWWWSGGDRLDKDSFRLDPSDVVASYRSVLERLNNVIKEES